jgi:thiazole tautomerase (transcriptional regulator TenI)
MRALGSRGALHLRAPELSVQNASALVELALTLAEEQFRTECWLVITDRVDIAMIARARGIQLTGASLLVADACRVALAIHQRRAGSSTECDVAVGASVHSLEEGIGARLDGANWGVVSHVLASAAQAPPAREPSLLPVRAREEAWTELVGQVTRASGIPIVAIGGVLPHHVAALRRLGVHGVAAIRGVWDHENAAHAACEYLSAYDSAVG